VKNRTYTIDQVAEDLAAPFLVNGVATHHLPIEIAACPELSSRPRVRDALLALDEAQNAVAIAAAIELPDRVAAHLAYSFVWRVLNALDDVLVLAGVRDEADRFRSVEASDWDPKAWESFVESRRAWEMLSCR